LILQPTSAFPQPSVFPHLRAIVANRTLRVTAAALTALTLCQPLTARTPRLRSRSMRSGTILHAAPLRIMPLHSGSLLAPGVLPPEETAVPVEGAKYELRLRHLHTGETLNVVYRIGNTYLPEAIAKLNHFLRDHRTEDQSRYDPREFDVLHNVLTRLGKPNGEIDVVCGYRTPWSNNFLRNLGPNTGVAKNSQHVQAKAIDIRVPGVRTRNLRDAALSLQAGGVGYYPLSQFVHVDVGPVRQWTFGGRGE